MHELADQILSHLKAIWRYRWYAVVSAWIIAIGGWTAVYLIPDRYEAYARVYVDTQSVLRPLLSGLAVQPNLDQLVPMMSRTLISRPNVEKVIRMSDMDIGLKTSEDREQLITRLTRELAVKSTGRENLYTITYSDQNPERAKRVVQVAAHDIHGGKPRRQAQGLRLSAALHRRTTQGLQRKARGRRKCGHGVQAPAPRAHAR